MRNMLMIVLAIGAALSVTAQESNKELFRSVPGGFGKASEYPNVSEQEKVSYARGFVNGLLVSSVIGAEENKVAGLYDCVKDMSGPQLAAIIDKYIKEHPEEWHLPLPLSSFNSIRALCPVLKVK